MSSQHSGTWPEAVAPTGVTYADPTRPQGAFYQERWNLHDADDRGGLGPNGRPSLTVDQAAAMLTRGGLSWSAAPGQPATVTFAFRSTPGTMPDGTSVFSQFTTAQINATLLALQAWSDVANVTFVRAQDSGSAYSDDATILFGNYRFDGHPDHQSRGLSHAPGSTDAASRDGDVWIQWEPGSGATPRTFQYDQLVLVREIGHVIGLSYGSFDALPTSTLPYFSGLNGPGLTPAWYEDTRQYSVMSPFSEERSGADWMVGSIYSMAAAPMLDDIAAAQRLYGANMTTRTGDTVYGFNSTADRPWFAPSDVGVLVFAAWDAGGVDTFDFSGFSVDGWIDLRQGAFSSVGPRPNVGPFVGNVAIAMGTVIENAIGGSGNDDIRGNSANNRLTGGLGDDVIDGGLGTDTVVFRGNRSDYTISWIFQTAVVTGPDGTDTVTNVEFLQFDDQIVVATPVGGVTVGGDTTNDVMNGTAFSDVMGGQSGNDTLNGLGSADSLYGGMGDDVLNGGDGDDGLTGGLGDDVLNGGAGHDGASWDDAIAGVTIDLAAGTATGGGGSDTLISIEEIYGSRHADVIRGTSGADVLRAGAGGGGDVLHGRGGADRLYATSGGSTLNGDEGDDRLYGGEGADVLNGGDGNDVLDGAGGNDVIDGGAGDDQIIDQGDALPDTLRGGSGNDVITASIGNGSVFDGGADVDTLIVTWDGSVTIDLQAGTAVSFSAAANVSNVENVTAGTGNDRLLGSAAANVLRGGDGNDVLTGGGGSDAIDGGAGYDVAGYAGARKGYGTVNSTTVVGGREGGTDSLTGIEAAAFVDGLVSFNADGQAAQLMRLYSTAFDRAPDATGFHVQLDALEGGVTMAEMARRFLTSDEFTSRFGSLTDIQYVQRLYQNAFDRQPSNTEINDWLSYLNAGNSRQALMLVIAESAESRTATWPTLSAGLWVGDAVTEGLARLYDTVFNRLPDENGLITWRATLGSGATLTDVAAAFLATAEGQAIYGGLSNADFVTRVYQTALNRAPDAGGLAAYTAGLNAGTITRAQMLAEVSESSEHRAIVLPNLVGGITTQAPAPAPVEADAVADDHVEPQVLPGPDDAADGKDGGPQTVPSDPDGSESKDAGPQVLPGAAEDASASAKDAGPLVLPGLADDDFLTLPSGDSGREWAGLAARRDGDLALEVPTFAADDFLPSELKSVGPQVLPAEPGLDLDALFESSAADLALEQALDALSPAPVKPIVFDAEDALHHLPAHDAFQ